jgi:hypothetical protein
MTESVNNDLKGGTDENYEIVTGPAHPYCIKDYFGRLCHGTEG